MAVDAGRRARGRAAAPRAAAVSLLAHDRGADEPDGAAGAEAALRPADEVVGEGLGLDAVAIGPGRDAGVLAPGERLEEPEAPAVLRPADQLPRAEDRGRLRRVDELPARPELRHAPDAPRVEEEGLRVEVRRVVGGAAAAEAQEHLAALGEERPLLLEERLERGEVHDRGVHLDLAEVGVDGADERHPGPEPVAEVEPGAPEGARAVVPGISPRPRLDVLGAARDVGQQLEVPPRLDPVEPLEQGHPRREAALVLRDEGEPRALVLAVDDAARVDAPRVAGRRREAQLRERHADLDASSPPSSTRDGRLPHRVPRVVLEVVVVDRGVALHAGRAHLQHDAGATVAVRVEVDRERVGLGGRVAARELAGDARRLVVVEPRADVEGVVVEEEADLGRLGRGPALVGVALQERRERRGVGPRGLVERAVDRDRVRRAHRAERRGGGRGRPRHTGEGRGRGGAPRFRATDRSGRRGDRPSEQDDAGRLGWTAGDARIRIVPRDGGGPGRRARRRRTRYSTTIAWPQGYARLRKPDTTDRKSCRALDARSTTRRQPWASGRPPGTGLGSKRLYRSDFLE